MSQRLLKGFVLRTVSYGENRRLLEVLSSDGSLELLSFSLSGRGKTLAALGQAYALAEFECRERHGRLYLQGGQLLEAFLGLQKDFDQLASMAHASEVFIDALRQAEKLPEAYELWAYMSHQLQKSQDPAFDVQVACLKLLCLIGFAPWLQDCVRCHQGSGLERLSCEAGGLLCSSYACQKEGEQTQALSPAALACLRYLLHVRIPKLYHFSLKAKVRRELYPVLQAWLFYQMEKDYQRLHMIEEARLMREQLRRERSAPRFEED